MSDNGFFNVVEYLKKCVVDEIMTTKFHIENNKIGAETLPKELYEALGLLGDLVPTQAYDNEMELDDDDENELAIILETQLEDYQDLLNQGGSYEEFEYLFWDWYPNNRYLDIEYPNLQAFVNYFPQKQQDIASDMVKSLIYGVQTRLQDWFYMNVVIPSSKLPGRPFWQLDDLIYESQGYVDKEDMVRFLLDESGTDGRLADIRKILDHRDISILITNS